MQTKGEDMTQAEIRAAASALHAEAKQIEAELPALRKVQAEAQEALDLARAIGNTTLIAAQAQALEQAQQLYTHHEQKAQTLRQDAQKLLADLVA